MDKTLLTRLANRLDAQRNTVIELETELTARPALAPENDGKGEQEKSEFIVNYLRKELRCEELLLCNAPDTRVPAGHRPNIVARIPGEPGSKTVWIMSHMDVVPAGDPAEWSNDPWTARVEDGKIFGRGTEDNQQGIVSSLLLAKAFRDEKLRPHHNLGLLFVSDEETASNFGIKYVLENHRDIFGAQDLILIPDSGNADGTLIEVAEKSILWLKFRVVGQSTHGSTPEKGINSLDAAASLIVKLRGLYERYNQSDSVFDPPISTFEVTKIEPNVANVNTVPGETAFYLDSRILPNYVVDEVWQAVREISQAVEREKSVTIEVTSVQDIRAAPPTPVDAPVVKALERAIHELRGLEAIPMGIGGGTVAAFFRAVGFHAAVWATQDETLHEPNEYVKIRNIIEDAKVFAHVAMQES